MGRWGAVAGTLAMLGLWVGCAPPPKVGGGASPRAPMKAPMDPFGSPSGSASTIDDETRLSGPPKRKIGEPLCDSYLSKVEECLTRFGDDPALRARTEKTHNEWLGPADDVPLTTKCEREHRDANVRLAAKCPGIFGVP